MIRFVHDKRPTLGPPPLRLSTGARPVAVTQPATADPIKEKVLEIVAEKTGYPKDMLDLDLDLEADLGVDTVKQAEVFASVRAAFNIARDENLKLRDFPTLSHVIQFARDRQAARRPGRAGATSPSRARRPVLASLDAAIRIPRRVPVPNLRPQLAMCKETGVTLGPGKRVVIMPDQGGVAVALTERLRTAGVEVLTIEPDADTDALANSIQSWLSAGPVHGVYWLPALDYEGSLNDMDLAAWREALRVRVKSLYATMRLLYEQMAAPDTFLVAGNETGRASWL